MKVMKWLAWILGILLVLGLVAGAGFTGYRIGLARGAGGSNAQLPFFGHPHNFPGNPNQNNGFSQMQHNHQGNGFSNYEFGFNRGRERMPFFAPFFGLLMTVAMGLLIWLVGYTLYKKSGWQFVRVNEPKQIDSAPQVANEGKKKKKQE